MSEREQELEAALQDIVLGATMLLETLPKGDLPRGSFRRYAEEVKRVASEALSYERPLAEIVLDEMVLRDK